MDDTQALRIVTALANGAHPVTGEIFPATSAYQTPEVIRALFVAVRSLESRLGGTVQSNPANRTDERVPASKLTKTNAGKSWTPEEDKQLLAEFDANVPLAEIARLHGRTAGGVRARLEKHGRLESTTARWSQDLQTARAATTPS